MCSLPEKMVKEQASIKTDLDMAVRELHCTISSSLSIFVFSTHPCVAPINSDKRKMVF